MEQPILSIISKGDNSQKTTPHLLPCRIHHSGPVEPIQTYWAPQEQDGQKTAYFRGRKLHGKTVRLPEGYRGVVMERKEPAEPNAARPEEPEVIDVDAAEEPDMGSLETKAEFDELVVWGHEATADASADPYVRSVEEWLTVAEQIHSYVAADVITID
ncbi:putative dna replication licensing factor mcm6 protein [Phaeoacremonium minimum UCRPA7]|uniref:Putative dna replication licensing factor mcm6 protein n=1 Tax=Phaeoacremonium minimum (strain UCR-PA7) TaxID=1286976 RepID=R8BWV8_PHAM7|nr:putative dna replication licensing factor mcm6 protein [Phaeoacremonium minimum UCRPA7]EOO03832.1 putative dna replication licensing factor mcm6 protein [Phaeoacremonium minimum UCRPA7]